MVKAKANKPSPSEAKEADDMAASNGSKPKDSSTNKSVAKTKASSARGSSPERKRFKITTHVDQPNKRAWQIKGVRIQGGLLGCYFKKSLSSGQDEQPYLRNFVSKVERYPFFRQQELGFMFVGTRIDASGNIIPANSGHAESEWHLFIAAEKDVGSMQDWLDIVCNRMNEDDIAGNDKLFKWKVAFTVTSWGDDAAPEKLYNLIKHDEAVDLVIGLHSLVNPHNRGKALDNVPFGDYFESHEKGKAAVSEHFNAVL